MSAASLHYHAAAAEAVAAAPEPAADPAAAPVPTLNYLAKPPPPPPRVPGGLRYRPTEPPEAPFVDPGDSPEACRATVLDMLNRGDTDDLQAVFREDPDKAAAFLERIGLAEEPRLRGLVRMLKMYAPSSRRRR